MTPEQEILELKGVVIDLIQTLLTSDTDYGDSALEEHCHRSFDAMDTKRMEDLLARIIRTIDTEPR